MLAGVVWRYRWAWPPGAVCSAGQRRRPTRADTFTGSDAHWRASWKSEAFGPLLLLPRRKTPKCLLLLVQSRGGLQWRCVQWPAHTVRTFLITSQFLLSLLGGAMFHLLLSEWSLQILTATQFVVVKLRLSELRLKLSVKLVQKNPQCVSDRSPSHTGSHNAC